MGGEGGHEPGHDPDATVDGQALPPSGASPSWSSDATATSDGEIVVGRRSGGRGQGDEQAPDGLALGESLGRYVIVERIGAGAMGVVFAAIDPDLDRKVAIKVIKSGGGDTYGPGGDAQKLARARLLREAQALAKLSHPNVVSVHDVGTRGDDVWIAMEFVVGTTLGGWLKAKPRGWREILDTLRLAGRGLAAAHAAGLIHRDFKPDNVMVGDDGRVRVMDFGLARSDEPRRETDEDGPLPAAGALAASAGGSLTPTEGSLAGASASELAGSHPSTGGALLDVRMTRAGAIMGTPAYMSPEQFSGGDVGPAADQFAFCVTAWEALYGERPFSGKSFMELAASVLDGHPRAPPATARAVPSWLRRTLERGLDRDPSRRWPGIEALLVEFERATSRIARRRATLVSAGVVAAFLSAWAWQRADRAGRVRACEARGAAIAVVWNDSARESLRSAFTATSLPYAAETAERLLPRIDALADEWQRAATAACVAVEVDRTWSDDLRDRAEWCLAEQRWEIEWLVDESRTRDATTVQRATMQAATIPGATGCARAEALRHMMAPPPRDKWSEITPVARDIFEAMKLQAEGHPDQARTRATTALETAQALGWAPLVASARFAQAYAVYASGDLAAAEPELEEAFFAALEAESDGNACSAATTLITLVGDQLGRHADGERWARHADVSCLPDDEGDTVMRARMHDALGIVLYGAARYDEAQREHERALQILEQRLGKDHPYLLYPIGNLGNVARARGDRALARDLLDRTSREREQALGPLHPETAMAWMNLAALLEETGDYEEALALDRRALASLAQSLGDDHPNVHLLEVNIAIVLGNLGRYDEALKSADRSVAALERLAGAEHPAVAAARSVRGAIHLDAGHLADAATDLQAALTVRRAALEPMHTDLAITLHDVGRLNLAQGDLPAARAALTEARTIFEAGLGAEHSYVAYPVVALARVEIAAGDGAAARELAARATTLREKGATPPELLALARATWARAEALPGGDPNRARALATQAITTVDTLGFPVPWAADLEPWR